jgi:hypothetical protein
MTNQRAAPFALDMHIAPISYGFRESAKNQSVVLSTSSTEIRVKIGHRGQISVRADAPEFGFCQIWLAKSRRKPNVWEGIREENFRVMSNFWKAG